MIHRNGESQTGATQMTTFRYFADLDGQTIELTSAGYVESISRKEMATLFPGVKAKSYDSLAVQAKRHNGQLLPISRAIEFKKNPSFHKCDDRCLHAKGHKCECACGGKNHGRGH
jgi:orotidine-5'-phosphate decarboxylase